MKDNTKISIKKDGNQWCVLWGKNLQEGIAGFGDTPEEAMDAFVCAVSKRLEKNCKYFSSDGDRWQPDRCELDDEEYPDCENCTKKEVNNPKSN